MFSFPRRRTTLSLAATICFALVVALGAAGFDQYFKAPLLETGDAAINALQIDNAKRFQELYGNYSRFEFNHPGPAFFYVYAAGEWLLYDWLGVVPAPDNAHLLTSMFVQCAFFGLALALMAAHLPGRVWLAVAVLAAAVYFGPLQGPFMSIWPPHVLLMPFLCFLAACCSVACGRFDHLPFAVIAGGFLFHGHVAQPLFVGSLGLLALSLGLWRLHRAEPAASWKQLLATQKRHWIWAGSLVAIFLLPLAIDVILEGRRSNVATIIGRFYANTGDSKSLVQSFLYFVSYATPAQNQEELFTVLGPQTTEFFRQNVRWIVFWTAIVALTPCLAWVWPSRLEPTERRFLLTGHLVVAAAIAGAMLWGMAQAGPMVNFNSFFYYAIYFFALLLALGWLDRFIRHPGGASLAAALCAVAAVAATWAFRLPRWSESETGGPLKRATEQALKADPTGAKPKLLVFEHASWPTVAAVALDLQRERVPFYMAPWWGFMFGYQHSLRRLGEMAEDHAAVWWITRPGEGGIPLTSQLSIFTKPAPIKPTGDAIRFRSGENAFRYVVSGVSAGNVDFAWSELPRVVAIFAPLPTDRDVRLVFEAQSAMREADTSIRPSPAVIAFNGREIGRLVAQARGEYAITVPRDVWNSQPTAKLELRFPEALRTHSYKRPRHEWWVAWGLWSIRFEPAP